MEFIHIGVDRIGELWALHQAYKEAIGEDAPAQAEQKSLTEAICQERIHFYGCLLDGALVACCSVCLTYSTFHYGKAGVLEDFYIRPEYRHQGIARRLVAYAREQSGVGSLTVGCADCDVGLYQAIGFTIPLGNLMAWGE